MHDTVDRRPDVVRELLTYLGRLPHKLNTEQIDPAEIAITLGNAFLWVDSWLEPSGPKPEQGLEETPQSLYALAKQFRAVGLKLIDRKKAFHQLNCSVEARLESLERHLGTILTRTGGAL